MAKGQRSLRCQEIKLNKEIVMLYWAVVFLVIALVAAILGFGGIAGTAVGIAQILFWVFLVVFLVSLILGFSGRKSIR
jgi:uncharacterized membrane protein YtjA (UPF0391 family)